MPMVFFVRPNRVVNRSGLFIAALLATLEAGGADQVQTGAKSPEVTRVTQLRRLDYQKPNVSYFVRLEGDIWWANPAQGRIVLSDSSGAEELEMDLAGQSVRPGQRVRLEGNGTITRRGSGFRIGVKGAVVDNNGVHSMVEKSGAVYLKAGWQPIRIDWFNGVEKYGLEVEYEGPGLPRQRIPDAVFCRQPIEAAGGPTHLVAGLDFRCYEGTWEVLPDFHQLTPVKSGRVPNCDLGVRTRDEHVALQFEGYLDAPRDGAYTFYTRSDDGSRLFVGGPSLRREVIGQAEWPTPRRSAIGQTLPDTEGGQWAEVEGKVTLVREQSDDWQMELRTEAGRMRVEVGDGTGLNATLLVNKRICATGFCQGVLTTDGQQISGLLLVPSRKEIRFIEALPPRVGKDGNVQSTLLPVLTTAGEVHRLRREEAQRGYPVRIQGVVTCVLPEHQAFTLQDATRGLYVVDSSASRSDPPQIGEFLAIEGATDPSLFAPIVNARKVTCLGAGHLPEPLRPTWDQLMNGSLDAQFVELQGIVAAVHPEGITLLTRDGRIKVELRVMGRKPEALEHFENTLVHVRGCLFASWDYVTHQVKVGEIRIYDADIVVDQPAPEDLFSAPGKTVAELLLFDPQAGLLQRVKVAGRIVHVRGAEHFLMDGTNGLRFITKKPAGLRAGDLVEVVGFPELSGGVSPVLREAEAHKTGQTNLLDAPRLRPDDLLRADYDSTRVRVEGWLAGIRRTRTGQVLELQNGVRTFVARLEAADGSATSLPVGSRLELTGVYAALGGNRVLGQDIASFELLLNSTADIKVLARPPWWTLERLLVIVGVLACVLAMTVLWITQLRRQVGERTAELEAQIQERQRVEHQRALEEERARIAQDLHDELGSGITEISMLADRAKSASPGDDKRSRHLEQVGDKARTLVTALDEIVWAMNPRHDSLASLVSYFCLYADRFLGLAGIPWRLEGPTEPPDHVVDSRHRHQLFLAFKEALTNVVRHARATEVRLSIQLLGGEVRLTIADNGCGLPAGDRTEEMEGVANMRSRIEKLGGRFEVASETGRGTVVRFHVPSS